MAWYDVINREGVDWSKTKISSWDQAWVQNCCASSLWYFFR